MEEMKKVYEPLSVEARWYEFWKEKKYFHANPDSSRPPFSMVIPPPNVTGVLHMGHALNNTLQDVIARHRRMLGYEVLWMPGTDHAGIATQAVVERELEKEGESRKGLGREKFIERVWEWKEKYGSTIIEQLERLGCSCDWDRTRFTMDEGCSLAVRTVFKELYDEGLIYKGKYIINWCPRCGTALSDIEVEHRQKKSHLWYVRYPWKSGEGGIVVATTRPETMLGDTAVAVNPSDERYKGKEGKIVILPLVEKPIPVIADDYVDPDFGTGAVKVTPAHDPNDFEIGLRHGLEQVNILNPDGTIGENGSPYQGMDRYEAREAVVRDLRERGFLEKVEEYEHAVGHCYRCGTEIEPYLTTQWFVKTEPLAKPAIEAVRSGRITFTPQRWEKIYFEWMENIKDWCISRQLWWGHRIPVWYCEECGKEIVSIDEPERCSCGSGKLRQDPDVLDTWFSSGLWPFSTMGWPEQTKLLEVFYPTSVLVTAFDIIFFWVARMIMMGLRFMDDVPFRKVLITALVRDYEGKKMSKSSGNVIDPIDVIDKYGTDALRFTLASAAHPGRDINLSEEKIEGNRNFVNKIWNASRLVLMNLGEADGEFSSRLYDDGSRLVALEKLGEGVELSDRWILSRTSRVITAVSEAMESYEFSVAGKALHQFFWGEFCDWYLELAKSRFYQGKPLERKAAQSIASCVLECSLRLLHPFMPFITEEIWQKIPGTGESIMVSSWPRADGFPLDPQAEAEMSVIQPLITSIRSARSEHGIPPSEKLDAVFVSGDREVEKILVGNQSYIESLCGLSKITYGSTALEGYTVRAVGIGVQAYLFVPQADVRGEVGRLERKLAKTMEELAKCQGKLSNEQFVKNAPAEVVEKEKEKERELLQRKEKLEGQIESLKSGF